MVNEVHEAESTTHASELIRRGCPSIGTVLDDPDH